MSTKTKKLAFILTLLVSLVAAAVTTAFVTGASSEDYLEVRIEYLTSDGSTRIHDPYVAMFPIGANVNVTVTNPVIPGYKPSTAMSGGETALTTNLQYTNLSESQTREISIYYLPDLVNYKVRFFKQNIRDDQYTEELGLDPSEYDRMGYTGEYPSELEEKTFIGFTSLFHEPDFVAADGSTIFKVYYDRNYYLINFDLDGGFGVEPIYAKYQSRFNIAEPRKDGYTFRGWALCNEDGEYIDSDGTVISESEINPQKFTSGTVPASNLNYKAVWTPSKTKYSVVYWIQKPESELPVNYFDTHDPYDIPEDELKTLVAENYAVIAAKDVENITSGTLINLNTPVSKEQGGTVPLKDFFSFNLNMRKTEGGADVDSDNKKIDFPTMSDSEREKLTGTKKYYFNFNEKLSLHQFGEDADIDSNLTVSGDGTTRVNVYYDRKVFNLKFFYAKTSGGTVTTDETGRAQWDKGSNGTVTLTCSTKTFSGNNKLKTIERINTNDWKSSCVSDLPQIAPKYADKLIPKFMPVSQGSATGYWYYDLSVKFGANLKDSWLNDAFLHQKRKEYENDENTTEYVRFGSWAVEFGSRYRYDSNGSLKSNFTIKGCFEKLDGDVLFQDSYVNSNINKADFNPTELVFVGSWDNTGGPNVANSDWNAGSAKIYNFTYENYLELLPYEKYIFTTQDGAYKNVLINGGDYPGGSDSEFEYDAGHFDAKYISIIENNGKYFGLTADNKIETYDAGASYQGKTGSSLGAEVKKNQTAAYIPGFKFIEEQNAIMKTFNLTEADPDTGEITTIAKNLSQFCGDSNPQCNWYDNDSSLAEKHHADVMFFYERQSYALKYRNRNELQYAAEDEAYFDAPLSLQKFQLEPEYPEADLRPYYEFGGWYFTPYYYNKVDFEHERMPDHDVTFYAKWDPKVYTINFYNDYNALSDETALHSADVEYDEYVLDVDVPTSNPDDTTSRPKLTPPTAGAHFSGWYYIKDGISVRFDPENMPVTRDLDLYAEWVSTSTANYRLRYVEKDNHSADVADPTTGTVFVAKTKSFNAKGGEELNESHKWRDGQLNWWPIYRSTSILVEPNDDAFHPYSPNERYIEYIQKDKVWYRIQYLDAATSLPLKPDFVEQIGTATATAKAPYIEGYIADRVTKTAVLAASVSEDSSVAYEQEVGMNTITFYYSKNDKEALYQINFMQEKLDSDDNTDRSNYELYMSDTMTIGIGDPVDFEELQQEHFAEALQSAGFEFVPELTRVEGEVEVVDPEVGAEITVDGHAMIIYIYYKRLPFEYSFDLVDYEQEYAYNLEMEKPEAERDADIIAAGNGMLDTVTDASFTELVGRSVNIHPDTEITVDGINYSRISDRQLSLVIRPNNSLNTIKVYYIKEGRYLIQYVPYCVIDTDDDFADVTRSQKIVQTVEEIEGSTVIENMPDKYDFMGWYENPDMSHEPVGTDLTFVPTMPFADIVYYAVFQPKYLDPSVCYEYSDDDGMTWIRPDGTVDKPDRTGISAVFDDTTDVTDNGHGNTTKHIVFGTDNQLSASATEASHYNFIGWYNEKGQRLSTEADHTFTIRDNVTYIARFKKEMVHCDVDIRCTSNGVYDPDDYYDEESFWDDYDNISYTGYDVEFSSPPLYAADNPTPYDESGQFAFKLVPSPDNNGQLYKYTFVKWVELVRTTHTVTIHGQEQTVIETEIVDCDEGLDDIITVPTTTSKHFVAVFKKVNEIDYRIEYKFRLRTQSPYEYETYVKKGTFDADGIQANTSSDPYTIALSREFVIANAPYESNYGETLGWNPSDIVYGYDEENNRLTAEIKARQDIKKVIVNYKTTPDGTFEPIEVNIGANRLTDKRLAAIVAEPELENGQVFSHWEIRKSSDPTAKVIAKCHMNRFSNSIFDNYWVTPVYADAPETASETQEITLTQLDYTRNQWTDADGNMSSSGETDLLYADFEISFADDFVHMQDSDKYSVGVVYELCATKPADVVFDPEKDYKAVTDEEALKLAIKSGAERYEYKANKFRPIQKCPISTGKLTNKNRVQYGRAYVNAFEETEGVKTYTNANYLMKVWAYSIDSSGNVTLSNPLYVCFSNIAAKNLAAGNGIIETD